MSVKSATSSLPKVVRAGLVLSRIPIVTPELNVLESQYYQYQNELEKRLMWTFPSYFYFKKGTLAERRFSAAQKGVVSKQPGVWFTKGVPDVKHNRERTTKQEIVLPREEHEAANKADVARAITPNSRVTKADESNDITSLERRLDKTLYLVVKDLTDSWKLPVFPVEPQTDGTKQSLDKTAESGLKQISNEDMNIWTVSNTPAGVLQKSNTADFLIKSHIIAGKFELKDKKSYKDFAWLTKSEIKDCVDAEYYKEIHFLLSDN